MKELIMPKFGFTQETAEVVEWLVQEGDAVEAGDPLLEVTTDKINMEVEAPVSGILAGVRVQVGDVVPVTEIIAYILDPGETLPADAATGPIDPVAPTPTEMAVEPIFAAAGGGLPTPVAARMAADLGVDLSLVSGSGSGGRITRQDVAAFAAGQHSQPASLTIVGGKVRATPAARRVAHERGLDLALLRGSGPNGRVQEADVLGYQLSARQPQAAEVQTTYTAVPLTNMRRTIGRNLQHSWQSAPHIMFQADMDMSAVDALLEKANDRLAADQPKLTITAVLTRAVAWTLGRHPLLNSQLVENEIRLMNDINIGIAVALDDGLIVPVVKHADQKGIQTLNEEIRELAGKARANKLKPDDLSGGTFSISNLGMFGIDRFTAIINPPQVGILAVGRSQPTFVPDAQGQPVLRPMCNMTLSVDHRVVDGAVAARFMQTLRQVLEEPQLMLL